jgi:hypothetical protein
MMRYEARMKTEETVNTEERSKRERGDAQVPTATAAAAKSTRSKRKLA